MFFLVIMVPVMQEFVLCYQLIFSICNLIDHHIKVYYLQ